MMKLENFLRKLSTVFAANQPVIDHPCKKWHEKEKQLYATVLAATISADNKIEKQQAILFGILLKDMGLKNKQRECFLLAEELTTEEIKNCCQILKDNNKRLHFLADITMLFRVDSPLTKEQITILNSWVNLLNITSNDINDIVFIVNKCLKINRRVERQRKYDDYSYFYDYFSYWAEQIDLIQDYENE